MRIQPPPLIKQGGELKMTIESSRNCRVLYTVHGHHLTPKIVGATPTLYLTQYHTLERNCSY